MTQLAMAFMILAVITSISMFSVAVDTIIYNRIPGGHAKWLIILLVSTVVFAFLAVVTNIHTCTDYTAEDYTYGRNPISCPVPKNIKVEL